MFTILSCSNIARGGFVPAKRQKEMCRVSILRSGGSHGYLFSGLCVAPWILSDSRAQQLDVTRLDVIGYHWMFSLWWSTSHLGYHWWKQNMKKQHQWFYIAEHPTDLSEAGCWVSPLFSLGLGTFTGCCWYISKMEDDCPTKTEAFSLLFTFILYIYIYIHVCTYIYIYTYIYMLNVHIADHNVLQLSQAHPSHPVPIPEVLSELFQDGQTLLDLQLSQGFWQSPRSKGTKWNLWGKKNMGANKHSWLVVWLPFFIFPLILGC